MFIYHNKIAAAKAMDHLGKKGVPFIFLIDFEMENIIINTDLKDHSMISYDMNGSSNIETTPSVKNITFDRDPMPFASYEKGFELVHSEIMKGNSFLLNLTYPTAINTNLSLEEIFASTSAKYKVLLHDSFVCYSPEIFIKIKNGAIYSYPMKGTIDASIENAEEIILNDRKEIAEHYTIVDLIRNDLSKVAKKVEVTKFRFVDRIKTSQKELLQVSSEIKGKLPTDWKSSLGKIIFKMLPAGSISGAPKKKTVDIIQAAEGQKRGYYTGICGHFDGENLDSGVMIRFIEKQGNQLFYRSGCGITSLSNAASEYEEMIDKVYLPISI